jgi:hypothetical protein
MTIAAMTAMQNVRSGVAGIVLMTATALGLPDAALAQSYPARLVKIIVPFHRPFWAAAELSG